jgi:hypothetical protein
MKHNVYSTVPQENDGSVPVIAGDQTSPTVDLYFTQPTGDSLEMIIQDDLTSLVAFNIFAQGHEVRD